MPARLKSAASDFFARLLPRYTVRLNDRMRACLAESPLTVVDVGAAMGVDKRWSALGPNTCRFVTFEPDSRSQQSQGDGNLVFATALGAGKGRRALYLTKGPFASSLLRHNQVLLRRFGVWEWHEPTGEVEVAVDRLDDCLESFPGRRPDFIKTDVEGADLDVLNGAGQALQHALGLQVEVAFVERHLGTPLFADIDGFLRHRAFMLFQLVREHWLRRNGLFGPQSRPQLIWADAVYFRDLAAFHAMMDARGGTDEREALLVKFVAILLVYGCHDYALEVVDDVAGRGLVEAAACAGMREAIVASARGPALFVARALIATGLASIVYLIALPFGARMRSAAGNMLAQQTAPLAHYFYRSAMRGGLARSCITDAA
jgi:FkbM family methyltransferase